MRKHDECEPAILEAQRKNQYGYAMFIAARCDAEHGPQLTAEPPPEREHNPSAEVEALRGEVAAAEVTG